MKLYESLNIRRDEVLPVTLFIVQSVFLGIFLGAFDVGANTLFLKSFDSSMISKAFAVSGMIGIIMTSIYTFFQSRIPFSRLSTFNLLGVFIITFLLRFGYYFSDSKWLAFGLFVMMGPLNIVALVGFWGTVSRIFDLRQGKRIFGIIDTGQVIGVILSSWAVPFLIANGFKTNNLLYISAFSIFVSFIFQIYIGSNFSDKLGLKINREQKASSFVTTLKVPYIRTMALFVVLSMLVAFFVHYLFLAVAGTRFENTDELAKFLGGLMGTLTFVSILVKSFVYGTLMNNYGLKVTLLVSPVIMAFLTIVAAIVGSLFGYTIESASFTFFFLVISLSKLFQKVLKDSIESPSLKMLYQSLDPSVRYEVQARVDGTVNEISALFSGLFLTGLSLISFFLIIHYTYVLILIIGLWAIVTFYLYRGYRKTLQATLMKSVKKEEEEAVQIELPPTSADIVAEQLNLIEKSRPWHLRDYISEHLQTKDQKVLEVCLKKINDFGIYSLRDELGKIKSSSNALKKFSPLDDTVSFLTQVQADSKDPSRIKELLASKNFEDRIYAAKVLGTCENPEQKNNLTFLMRDLVPSVKKQAIYASCGSASKEIISFLIDFLDKDPYAPYAHAALIGSGDHGLEMLELALQRSNVSDILKERIYRIIPETGSQKAGSVLFSRFSVKTHAGPIILEGLLKIGFKADPKAKLMLNQKIIEQAGVCAWNLNAFYHCPHHSRIPYLKDELEKEFQKSIQYLFKILKLVYDKNSIDAVLENLEAGTGQSISFAVELLDTFAEEEIKPYVIPLLEDTSLSNKIWSLENYFPLRIYNEESLITAIVNRDNNLISKQAKIYALSAFRYLENPVAGIDLVSQLFNTDKILRLISAQILEEIDKSHYLDCKKRLNDKLRVELDKQINLFNITQLSPTDRINFYKTLFKGQMNDSDVIYLLYQSVPVKVDDSDILVNEQFKAKDLLIFIESGGAVLYHGNEVIAKYKPGDIINIHNRNKAPWRLITEPGTLLHYLEYSKLESTIYDNSHFIKYLDYKE